MELLRIRRRVAIVRLLMSLFCAFETPILIEKLPHLSFRPGDAARLLQMIEQHVGIVNDPALLQLV